MTEWTEPTFEGVWNAMDLGTERLEVAQVHEIAAYFWRARQPRIDRLDAEIEQTKQAWAVTDTALRTELAATRNVVATSRYVRDQLAKAGPEIVRGPLGADRFVVTGSDALRAYAELDYALKALEVLPK